MRMASTANAKHCTTWYACSASTGGSPEAGSPEAGDTPEEEGSPEAGATPEAGSIKADVPEGRRYTWRTKDTATVATTHRATGSSRVAVSWKG